MCFLLQSVTALLPIRVALYQIIKRELEERASNLVVVAELFPDEKTRLEGLMTKMDLNCKRFFIFCYLVNEVDYP